MIAVILCGVTLAYPNYAQLLDREVSITMNDLPFEKALKEIEQVAKVKFAYSIDQLHQEPNVSLLIEKKNTSRCVGRIADPAQDPVQSSRKGSRHRPKKVTVEARKSSLVYRTVPMATASNTR
ncbi:MAG: hypothetical protein U5K54_25695 [Cytophagales bacterium]|nr:hypothetical protein [Cytophagales bacterium]